MFHSIKEDGLKPIDILILVNTIAQHIMVLIPVFTYIMRSILGVMNEMLCNVSWYAGIFGGAYRIFGSLGIAVYRLILIERNGWLISMMICIGFSIGFGTGNGPASRKQVTWNWCVGRNEKFREILHEYALITGSIAYESEYLAKFCVLCTFLGVILELVCYCLFYGHLILHDKGLFSRKVLKEHEFKRRRLINSMSFSGHFYGFIVECITFVGLCSTLEKSSDINFRLALAICFWLEFGIVSIVEVMTSQNLRPYLPHNRYLR